MYDLRDACRVNHINSTGYGYYNNPKNIIKNVYLYLNFM